jgi:hypothetical protein
LLTIDFAEWHKLGLYYVGFNSHRAAVEYYTFLKCTLASS